MTKTPSNPPPPNPRDGAGRHDSETSTVIAKAVDPALLRAAGGGARPPIPRPDPTRAKKPSEAPKEAPRPAAPPPAVPVAPLSHEVSFADMNEPSGADHTLAVRGFVLPRAAMPSPLGSEYDMEAVRVPTFPPQPDAYPSVPPAPLPGPATYPSDITRIAVNVSDRPPPPASREPSASAKPPSSRASSSNPPASRSGAPPASSRVRALAATVESPRTKVPSLLVERAMLLAARAVDKRESLVIAYMDGKLDIEGIAGETGFLPSETVEIVLTLVARGIVSIK